MTSYFDQDSEFLANGSIPVRKYISKTSPMSVYFADIDSQIINGYFCFGIDQPEATGIETLLWQLDSSGGLLPRALRGDMLRPAWQFHGAENPLADRDQSCFVCCALGETAFLGTFSCCIYLLQNLEAVFDLHDVHSPYFLKDLAQQRKDLANEDGDGDESARIDDSPQLSVEDVVDLPEPKLEDQEHYFLSEAGEGAMAWESTLQAMFPTVRAFWNRLLIEGKNRLCAKMRSCYDLLYRPENLTVIVTGTLEGVQHILEVLHEFEVDHLDNHPWAPAFVRPWNTLLPPSPPAKTTDVRYIPRNLGRDSTGTICLGWRGCASSDLETAMALKVITAYIAVGPIWTKLVCPGSAHRISWCQLEYVDTCSLITIHGIQSDKSADEIMAAVKEIMTALVVDKNNNNVEALNLNEVRAMADRIGWHYVRELEAEPFLVLASAISKAERYGKGSNDQVQKRMHPRLVFDDLMTKPLEFWTSHFQKYFLDNGTFATRVLPKKYGKGEESVQKGETPKQPQAASEMSFVAVSKRAASRPRMNSNNAVGLEANMAIEEDGRESNTLPLPKDKIIGKGDHCREGRLEEDLKNNPFPLGNNDEEVVQFVERLDMTRDFLADVCNSEIRSYQIASYETGSNDQHSLFNLTQMPFYTFLEDTKTLFVYVTVVIDTTHLDDKMRALIGPITAALGGVLCPRPPGLDTDCDIVEPNEFNPPMNIADSQVSLGLNGEMMQCIFITLIVRPDKYEWAVGMLHFLLYKYDFNGQFLKFVASEAARGLSSNYRMQTAESPKYESFEGGEINLHGLVKQIYKNDSNARLFVGRRRLDLMMDHMADLEKNLENTVQKTNKAWRHIVDSGKIILQIASDVNELAAIQPNLVSPWKKYFEGIQKSLVFSEIQPSGEPQVMTNPGNPGIVMTVDDARPACLSLAVPISPNSPDFPKLCVAAQLFSMAQKWVWSCLDEEDGAQPVLRMPCSYANLITLNLESFDIIGAFQAMKMIMRDDWAWIQPLLIATKLMVVNDPAAMELGAQGTIAGALLSHLNGQEISVRRDLLVDSMKVNLADIKHVIKEYLVKLFDPKSSWCSLVVHEGDKEKLLGRLHEFGFDFQSHSLNELCTNL